MGKRPPHDERADAFEARLIETGGAVDEPFDGQAGYGRDAEFRYRWWSHKVEVSWAETFDRWANSIEWVLHRPIETVDLDMLRAACHRCSEAIPEPDDPWHEIDIGGYYRQIRRKWRHG